jgi:hypothetical protein
MASMWPVGTAPCLATISQRDSVVRQICQAGSMTPMWPVGTVRPLRPGGSKHVVEAWGWTQRLAPVCAFISTELLALVLVCAWLLGYWRSSHRIAGLVPLYSAFSVIPQTSTTRPPQVGIWGSSWNQMIPPQIPPVSGIRWNQMTPPPDPTRSHQIPPYPTISHQYHASWSLKGV